MASASLVSSSPLLQLMIFLAFIMCLQLAPITMAQSLFPLAECSTTSGNFTNNSSYQTTLTSLFSSINSRHIRYGFFNASLNSKAEKVTAMGFCRGDVPPVACQICLQTSASDVRQLCPNQKEAIVWNDNCTFRYSNRSILNTNETDPNYQLINNQNASNQTQFNTALQSLLEDIRPVAAAGGSLRKLATSNTSVEFQKIYALVQCTPNLSEQQCSDCLATIIGEIPQCCAGKIGGRVMAPSCYLRFVRPMIGSSTIQLVL